MPEVDKPKGAAKALANDGDFNFNEAIGGWRGLLESVLPGVAFVSAFLIWGGFKLPVIAAVSVVVILVALRLVQKTPITQALSGLLGVALGAFWAWRVGDANGYFVPGFWTTGAYALAMLVSILIRWPLVGVVVALVRGWSRRWRKDPAIVRRMQWATAVYVISQAIRLAIQLPLYFAGATAALGTARLALGAPYFALTLWVMWLMVRRVELAPTPQDQPQPKE